ncbi:MAG: Ldh family oxidoreductase [Gluconacetobacter liquefaciens]
MSDRVRLRQDALRTACESILTFHGVGAGDAGVTADVFMQAELMGEESHGLRLFCQVVERIKAGGDRAETVISVLSDRAAVAHWDANRSLGQVVAERAMRRAIEKARITGIGLVAVRNGNSLTSAKYYPLLAARQGMVGVTFTNTSRRLMAPPGGTAPVVGNNPVAYAAPAGRYGCFTLDMACTTAAVERIIKAKEKGEEIPRGWALDREGRETTDPSRALEAMSLLPFGGQKAFSLGVVHEILTSVLADGRIFGGGSSGFKPYDGAMNTAFTMLAIDIAAFQDPASFEATMEEMIGRIKATPKVEGGGEILFPGERSQAEVERRMRDGIPLSGETLRAMNRLAEEAGLARLN